MPSVECPKRDELLDYLAGKMPDDASDSVAEHLESCTECQAELATLSDVEDTLVARLRGANVADPFLDESECGRAVLQAKGGKGDSPHLCEAPEGPFRQMGTVPFSPEPSETSLPGQLGEYRPIERLGAGGMGAVYRALHSRLDRVVALKVLPRARTDDPRAIVRFEREMKAIGRLDDPHIVRAYDAREIDGRLVLVMEFVEGLDLGKIVRRLGSVPAADASELARQAALGLQAAHEHGMVHRDVKPSNLMLTPEGVVKVLDLGLARFQLVPDGGLSQFSLPQDSPLPIDPAAKMGLSPSSQHDAQREKGTGTVAANLIGSENQTGRRSQSPFPDDEATDTGQAMGTADYMAPEQAADSHAVDIRADVYSLGATLYKLLSGHAPFDAPGQQGTFEKLLAHRQTPLPPIRRYCPDIPAGLVAVVERMLSKDPAARYATPLEASEALAPFCIGADLPALLRRAMEAKAEIASPKPLAVSQRRKPRLSHAIVLLLVGVFCFAAGVLITITKDGKQMSVEVPLESTTRIGADRKVDVTLPGETKRPASTAATIGKSPQNTALEFEIARVAAELAAQQALLESVDKNKPPRDEYLALIANDPIAKRLDAEVALKRADLEAEKNAVPSSNSEISPIVERTRKEFLTLSKLYDERCHELAQKARDNERSRITNEIVRLAAELTSLQQQEKQQPIPQAVASATRLPPVVTVAHPTVREITDHFDCAGRIQPIQTAEVRPQANGRLTKVHFQVGAMVKKGDVLMEMSSAEATPTAKITAPIDGRISQIVPLTIGKLITADSEEPLATIVSLDSVYVCFPVDQNTVLQLRRKMKPNAPLTVLCGAAANNEDFPYQGKVESVDVPVSPDIGAAQWRAAIVNKDGSLLPGMFVRVRLLTGAPRKALLIPMQAVSRTDRGEPSVFVAKQVANPGQYGAHNIVERRIVKLGQAEKKNLWVVEEGLTEGDSVVVSNSENLRPDMIISPMEQPPTGPIFQFGPIAEKFLDVVSDGNGGQGLRLDLLGGRVVDLPKGFHRQGDKLQDLWCADNCIDVFFSSTETLNPNSVNRPLLLVSCRKPAGIFTKRLEDVTNADVYNAYVRLKDAPGFKTCAIAGFPIVFAAETSNGDVHIVEASGFVDGKNRVKVRYMLSQPQQAKASNSVDAPAVNSAADLKALQGPWKVVRVEKGKDADSSWQRILGYDFGATDPAAVNRFDFEENMLKVMAFSQGSLCEFHYRIDPTATAKAIDFSHGSFAANKEGDLGAVGIYQLDGDRLKICLTRYMLSLKTDQRPKQFAVAPGSSDILFTLERFSLPEDYKVIQDTWSHYWAVVSQIDDGKPIPAEKLRTRECLFQGNSAFWIHDLNPQGLSHHEIARGQYVLDAAKQPKELSVFDYGESREQDLHGIYKLDGERLTIAYRKGGQRPATFESKPGSGVTLLECRKTKRPRPAPIADAESNTGMGLINKIGTPGGGMGGGPTATVNSAAEFKALQGSWKVVRVEKEKDAEASWPMQGRNMSVAKLDRLHCSDNYLDLVSLQDGSAATLRYRIDPAASPKTIDLFEQGQGDEIGVAVALGCYEVKGDRLTIRLARFLPVVKGNQRPGSVGDKSASGSILFQLERHQPSEDEKAIQGNWTIADLTEDGKVRTEGNLGPRKIRFTDEFFNVESVFSPETVRDLYYGVFALDPHGTRESNTSVRIANTDKRFIRVNKSITLFNNRLEIDPDGDGPTKLEKLHGIYKFDGDRLTIAYRKGDKPPEMYESKPGSDVTLLTLKRGVPTESTGGIGMPGMGMPGGGMMMPAQPKEPPLQFGPVVERAINTWREHAGNDAIDLVGGKLINLPKDFSTLSAEKQGKWCEDNNVDLANMDLDFDLGTPKTRNKMALVPEGMKLAAIWVERWNNDVTREELCAALASATPGKVVSPNGGFISEPVSVIDRKGVVYFAMEGDHVLPATFAFQTRKGELGLMQVLRYTEQPIGLRIRYKLAKPATEAPDMQKTDDPAAAVSAFLEAVRSGNEKMAAKMLSSRAREKSANRSVTPPASSTAKFTVGKVEYVNDDGARVATTWTDLDANGQLKTDEAIWVMRREHGGWRITGVAAAVFPGEPPVLLNFEDPEDMWRKQQWIREEMRRRTEKPQEVPTPPDGARKHTAARKIGLDALDNKDAHEFVEVLFPFPSGKETPWNQVQQFLADSKPFLGPDGKCSFSSTGMIVTDEAGRIRKIRDQVKPIGSAAVPKVKTPAVNPAAEAKTSKATTKDKPDSSDKQSVLSPLREKTAR